MTVLLWGRVVILGALGALALVMLWAALAERDAPGGVQGTPPFKQ